MGLAARSVSLIASGRYGGRHEQEAPAPDPQADPKDEQPRAPVPVRLLPDATSTKGDSTAGGPGMRRRAFLHWLGLVPLVGPVAMRTLGTSAPIMPSGTLAAQSHLTPALIDKAIRLALARPARIYPVVVNGKAFWAVYYRR